MMSQFERLGHELARASLQADLEYIRWSGRGIYDAGCESMLSTSAARAASAFFGISGDTRVHLEQPVRGILDALHVGYEQEADVAREGGRIDCYVEVAGEPLVLIECKRYLQASNISRDVTRLLSIVRQKRFKGIAMIVGARRQREGAKDKEALIRQDAAALEQQHDGVSIKPIIIKQQLDESYPIGATRGGKGTWTHSVGACLLIAG